MYDFSNVNIHKFDADDTKRLITNKMGRQYWVWAGDALYLQRFGAGCPPYQSRNLKFLRACCPEQPKALDIGMNVGNNTMEYATWCREVHSFEPFPSTFELGECSIAVNLGKTYEGRYYADNDQNGVYTQDVDFPMGWWKEADNSFAPTEITGEIFINHCGLGLEEATMLMEDHPNNAGHNCITPEKRKLKTTYAKHEVKVKVLDNFNFEDVDFPMGWWKEADNSFAPTEITGEIFINHCGLGLEEATMLMEDHPNNAGHNCITPEKRKLKTTYAKHEVKVKVLDNFNFEDVDFIKVDVEGYEFNVIKGGKETIKRNRPVVQLEIVEKQCKDFQYTPQDLYDFFIKDIGDYVACDYAGNDLGPKWIFLKRCMDHFFVPREVFDSIDRKALLRNVGKGSEFHKREAEALASNTEFGNLFDEVK